MTERQTEIETETEMETVMSVSCCVVEEVEGFHKQDCPYEGHCSCCKYCSFHLYFFFFFPWLELV